MVILITCHTPGCVNEDIAIPLLDPAERCVCGPCDIEVTDKVESNKTWDQAYADFIAWLDINRPIV